MAFVYAWIVPLWADQLLPQLLMEQFDTLSIQCRHIEHMHGGVYNFCVSTDSTCQVFFTESFCAGGVSKALLIDFFSFSLQTILICQVENPFKTDVNVKKFIEYLIE